jgi:hypothetical protein
MTVFREGRADKNTNFPAQYQKLFGAYWVLWNKPASGPRTATVFPHVRIRIASEKSSEGGESIESS